MINVIYICPNGYLGGAERFVLEACYAHQSKGKIDSKIIFFDRGSAVDEAKKRNIKHVVLKKKIKLSNPFSLLRGCFEVRTHIKSHQASIVHETMPYSHIVAFIATLFMGIKKVWYQHGPVGGTLDQIASFLPVDQVLFNSSYLLNIHHKYHPSRFAKYDDKVIPCGVSIPETKQETFLEIQNKYAQNKVLMLLAGRICSWKGYETGLIAIKKIIDIDPKYRDQMHLVIVGDTTRDEDKSYKESLVDYVKEHDLGDVITFAGFKTNISDYMKACDIFLHTSNIPEPFGLVVGEAMGQGALVIGSNKGGVQDMIIDGITGFSFDSTTKNSSDKLVDKVLPLIDRFVSEGRPIEKLISKSGEELIKKKFNIEILEKRLSELYVKI